MKRIHFLSLLLMLHVAVSVSATSEGPWTFSTARSHLFGYDGNAAVSFNNMNCSFWNNGNKHYVRLSLWQDDGGIGLFMKDGNSQATSAMTYYGIFYHTETVEPYSCKRLKWTFSMTTSSNYHRQAVGLYALNGGVESMKNLKVDCTEGFYNNTGNGYRIGSAECQGTTGSTNDFTKTFDFDNSNGSSEAYPTWSLMLTLSVGNGGDARKNIYNYGMFKHKAADWETLYYKHVTFDANGGKGTIQRQTIENKGNLTSNNNYITRSGFIFNGWNTQANGKGTAYANGGNITASASDRGPVTLYAQWIPQPSITKCEFQPQERKVRLAWSIAEKNITEGQFAIYRNGTLIDSVACKYGPTAFAYEDKNTATETNFPYEKDVTYTVYYVAKGWTLSTKRNDLKSEQTVNTTRNVPILEFQCEGQDTSVMFSWKSDAYEAEWGNQFKIYIDNEEEPVITIRPYKSNMTSFRWEHRSVTTHDNRKNFLDSTANIWYTEEAIDACSPHAYKIVGVVDDSESLSEQVVEKRSIDAGTSFESMEASKAVYGGKVKLTWQVNLRGSLLGKTYTIYRRRAEQTDETWTKLDDIVSDQSYVSYTDDTPQTGVCYEYKVVVVDKCEDGTRYENQAFDIGFAKSTGTVSGRVTYGSSGMAVADVDVIAHQASDANNAHQFYSIYFNKTMGRAEWVYPENDYAKKLFGGDFSLQLWVAPDATNRVSQFVNAGAFTIGMKSDGTVTWSSDTVYVFDSIQLGAHRYDHLTFTHKDKMVVCSMVRQDENGVPRLISDTVTLRFAMNTSGSKKMQLGGYIGYMDEVRIWTKALSKKEILTSYDRMLVGNEKNLETYWTFDEGLRSHFYDYSRDGSVYRGHHGKLGVNVKSSYYTPSLLALKATTDSVGNYIINGIPFTGDGTTYAIIPQLGIHEFNPSQQQRFISANSLVHNSTDFEDISSFKVSGVIYYANTDYPVEGCNFYVDGTICAQDGNIISSHADGTFEISVPIGYHFIEVKKNGHVFANNGRYPEDKSGNGDRHNFDTEVKNLVFKDETLVNFTGRVVGGEIEGSKQIGFGKSVNNIGMATLTLVPQNSNQYRINVVEKKEGTITDYLSNPDILPIASASPDTIRSVAWRGADDECNRLYIRTDSATGEFSAMVPPLVYTVQRIEVASSGLKIIEGSGDAITLDMTNTLLSYTDSAYNDLSYLQYYKYHTLLRQTYHPEPTFRVQQADHPDGSFGIDAYEVEDGFGTLKLTDIHHLDANGKVEYTYGYPLFEMGQNYVFEIEGQEKYVNMDSGDSIVSNVPMANTVVTIENAISADQVVCSEDNTDSIPGSVYKLQSNQLLLDSTGRATYKWMAGIPNITPPFARTINIYYGDALNEWSANPMEAVLLGYMPTGNNFVTSAPDKLDIILRDPPGSQSYATWETGTFIEHDTIHGKTWDQQLEMKTITMAGAKAGIASGFVSLYTITELKATDEFSAGVVEQCEGESADVLTRYLTATRAISTSSSPEYDGAEGDLFIGSATNLIFGNVRSVDLYRSEEDTTKAVIALKDALSTSVSFGTEFAYTQYHIVNTLLPNFAKLRNSLLIQVNESDFNSADYPNPSDKPIYLTLLSPSDPQFGQKETYRVVLPDNNQSCHGDTIAYYNNQIAKWKEYLAQNEQEKAEAFAKRSELASAGKVSNYSFDAGASQTITSGTDTRKTHTYRKNTLGAALIGNTWGMQFNEVGIVFDLQSSTGGGTHYEDVNDTTRTATLSYTLQDNDITDAISVDVYDYGAYGTSIFRTRGGQTSNPYEGEVVTQYYNPGTTIMEATMQVEVPDIEVVNPIVSQIPSGSTINYELHMTNASDIGADCYFRLLVADETNPNSAVLTMDGRPITDSRVVKIPYGQTIIKTLQLKQSDVSVLDYDNIALVLASVVQSDPTSHMAVIADTVVISAHFAPSSSPVTMALSTTTMNTQTGTDLVVKMSDFDRYYHQLKAFRLQYKSQGDDWTLFHEYVLNEADLRGSVSELLPAEATVSYTLPMEAYSDGDYRFRIVSVSTYAGNEITVLSNEIALVKDMSRPRVLGTPEPADGILDIGDELSVTFNEPILYGELTTTKNFLITGVLNGSPVQHAVALRANEGIEDVAAKTDADLNLAYRDFSMDMWLNVQSAGLLLTHGEALQQLRVGVNEAQQITISYGDSVYTAKDTIPFNRWVFFTFSIRSEGKLSASIAYDDVTQILFLDKPTARYQGRGPIAVGGGAGFAIHELLLWDEVRDIATALQQRSVTKSPATRHLIGYWKMNEGEGTVVRDYARNRHMAMKAETWYLNNINKSVKLDGTQTIAICTANVPPMPEDDYAVEFWMRGEMPSDSATLFRLGKVSLFLSADGTLVLESNGRQWSVTNPCTANVWHHIALNVLRLGTTTLYVDGVRALTLSSAHVGSLASDSLRLGEGLTGEIDEIRLWHATMSGEQLAQNSKIRLNGDEPGLSLYYPFEKKELDDYDQIVVSGTLEELTGHGTEASVNAPLSNIYSDDAPALREKMTETNVAFSFTASNEKIVLTINEDPDVIEGCTLNFTVREVRDVNGNHSTPVSWTAFVHRNEIEWQQELITLQQQSKTVSSFTATLVNRSGTAQMWTLSNLPVWLSVDQESGTLNPTAATTITFTVSEATPIGKYAQTIYASGNNGIETPLTLHIAVIGDVPQWNVNPTGYAYSMDIIGQLEIFGVSAEDEDDIVAAFIDDECRGVAQPQYKKRYDGYYLTLTVYGDADDNDKEITFRAYDASTGITYSQVRADRDVPYRSLTLIGNYTEPVVLNVEDKVEQHLTLHKGWNWISLNVATDDMCPTVLLDNVANDVILIKGQTNTEGFLQHDANGWSGTMDSLRNTKMYAVKMNADRDLRLVGKRVNPQYAVIPVDSGWNWIGYYEQQRMTVADAFAPLDPQHGDILRSQRNICYFDDYEWVGSLLYMEPGAGYILYSTVGDKSFAYPGAAVASAPRRIAAMAKEDTVTALTVNELAYPYNMTLVAQVLQAGEPLANTEIGIFAADECRAIGQTDSVGMMRVLIQGDEPVMLTFKKQSEDHLFEAKTTLAYETDAIVGSAASPFMILFDQEQGIDNLNADTKATKVFYNGTLYILQGGKIYTATGAEVSL